MGRKNRSRPDRSNPKPPPLYLGREPLESVKTWMAQHIHRLQPGVFTHVIVAHDAECNYPGGEACTCRCGPMIRIEGERPEEN
jgi:hypothetical protein